MNDVEMERVIPRNRKGKQRIGDICRRRNLIEGIIFTSIVIVPIILIPFTFQAQVTLCVLLGGMTFLLNLIGIKNRSVTEYLVLYIKDKNTRRVLKLTEVWANAKKKNRVETDKNGRQTRIEQMAYEIIMGWEEGAYDDMPKSDASNESKARYIARAVRKSIEAFRTNLGI